MSSRPPLPPFTEETARQKVQAAEDAWNSCDPERVALAYSEDSQWRNRDEFFEGRDAIRDFLRRKWAREREYRLKKELWCFTDNRISVRFEPLWDSVIRAKRVGAMLPLLEQTLDAFGRARRTRAAPSASPAAEADKPLRAAA